MKTKLLVVVYYSPHFLFHSHNNTDTNGVLYPAEQAATSIMPTSQTPLQQPMV